MMFLYPAFLYTLLLLAIPVVIHLFNFRRYKKVYFPNVKLLTEIQQESKSRNKLKHLLLLTARLLAVAALVFAFAQPYFPDPSTDAKAGKNVVSIYVDNSFSMSNIGSEGELLSIAMVKVEEIVKSYRETDEFNFITNDPLPSHRQFQVKERFLESLPPVLPGSSSRDISSVIRFQGQLLAGKESVNRTSYIISDFQKSVTDFSDLPADTSINIVLVPLSGVKNNNLYIDSAWYENPVIQINQQAELQVRIRNFGSEHSENIPVRYTVNEKQKALANVSIEAGSSIITSLQHTIDEPGWNRGVVSINDYPITFDDQYYLAFPVKNQLNILTVNQAQDNSFLRSLFKTNPVFNQVAQSAGSIDYSSLNNFDLIIFNELSSFSSGLIEEIEKYMMQGGNILVIPAPGGNINASSYSQLFARMNALNIGTFEKVTENVNRMNLEHPLFQNVFESVVRNVNLPSVQQYYRMNTGSRSQTSGLLYMPNGDMFLSQTSAGNGNFYISAVPFDLEHSNFPRHALFVPLIYQLASYSRASTQLSHFIGQDKAVEIPAVSSGTRSQVVALKKDEFEIIPEQRAFNNRILLTFPDQLPDAGFYTVNDRQQGSDYQHLLAFNYNRNESELDFYAPSELEALTTGKNIKVIKSAERDLSVQLATLTHGNNFWKLFILLSLLFLMAEILILKFWRQ